MTGLFPDKVRITPITRDAVTSAETVGTSYTSRAQWEEDSKIRYGADGEPLEPTITMLLPGATTIGYGYSVQLIEKGGQSMAGFARKVKKANPVGGFRPSHWEVSL